MGYSLLFAKSAQRQFDKLPRLAQQRLGEAIERLANNPLPPGVVKLSGEERLYRIRVGDYRAVYHLQDERLVILVIKVGHRREVYRDH